MGQPFSHFHFYNEMAETMCSACLSIPPVKADYSPTGSSFKLPDEIEVYETGDLGSKHAIIVVFDIFGFHPVTKKFADLLGEHGKFRVLVPDFLRGHALNENSFPLQDRSKFADWLQKHGSYANCGPIMQNTIAHLSKQTECNKISLLGLCWGAGIIVEHSIRFPKVNGVAMIHPSYIQLGGNAESAKKMQTPVLIVTTKDDPSYDAFFEAAKSHPIFGPLCVHQHFADMHHGFCGARGNWSDEAQAKRVQETLQLCTQFFNSAAE